VLAVGWAALTRQLVLGQALVRGGSIAIVMLKIEQGACTRLTIAEDNVVAVKCHHLQQLTAKMV